MDAGAAGLEQFTLLAKNARGRACVALIQQVLSNKKLFVFRELLETPNVQALQGTEHEGYYNLLQIFCYGQYQDYLEKKNELPELTNEQVDKLRKLTAVSLAHENSMVPYETLMSKLGVQTYRQLEDILIDTIYSGLLQGKLDQKSKSFVVKFAAGRDVQPSDLDAMVTKLQKWKSEASTITTRIDTILKQAEETEEQERQREENLRSKVGTKPSKGNREKFNSVYDGSDGYMNPSSRMGSGRHGKQRMQSMGRRNK